MDIGQELRRAGQQLPALPADIADRIMRALAAESDRRTEARSSGSDTQVEVPRQGSGAARLAGPGGGRCSKPAAQPRQARD